MNFPMAAVPVCPACSSVARHLLWEAGEAVVFRCKDCGLGYLDPALDPEGMAAVYTSTESLKRLHHFHDGYYEYTDLNKSTITRTEFLKHLTHLERLKLPHSPKSILDIGYGNGMFLALAKLQGWDVSGLDTSHENAALAKKNYELNLKVGFFQDDAVSNHVSAMTMLDLIEHQGSPHIFVKKAHEILSPAGLLLIAVPNEDSFLRYLAQFVYRLSRRIIVHGLKMVYVLEHVTYYNKKTLSQLLTDHGFEVVDSYYSSTDLEKYDLGFFGRIIGEIILFIGKLLGLQNRLVVIGRKKGIV